jgi:threonine aldolase
MSTRGKVIDLRSDTVTRPSRAMRQAMYEAEVADDTYNGDPTVRRLQEIAAARTGKEAALFVASGTMGNLIGVRVNTRPGQEVILGDQSHQFLWEVGGIARVGGCITHSIPFHLPNWRQSRGELRRNHYWRNSHRRQR